MYNEPSLWLAFSAGFFSFLSPCVLPLVPPYLCYISGLNLADLNYQNSQRSKNTIRAQLMLASLVFILGFSSIFIALGATASLAGSFLNHYRRIFTIIAGVIIIIMGLNFLGWLRLAWLAREWRFNVENSKGSSLWASLLGAYLMGLAFAFGWTPCIGPVLGPVLTLASMEDTVWRGAQLLAGYSLGLAVPFLLSAFFSNMFFVYFRKISRYFDKIQKFLGLALIITGIIFVSGQIEQISYWLLENFPGLSAF